MNSQLTEDFLACYSRLPARVREQARRAYRIGRDDAAHPGIQFQQIHASQPIFSARVGVGWRAVGLRDGDTISWFWIGTHAEYDSLIARI